MKVFAIDGGPRKGWNTDTLLTKALEGAASAGAETEMVHLYDLTFKGCVSCLGCKLRKEPRPNRCILRDDLTAVLDKAHEADAVILGSPIYFSEITGEARSFLERFLFQYLNYDNPGSPLSPQKRIGLVFTMNCPESLFDQMGYHALFQRYDGWMKRFFGHCETLISSDTLQAKDYSRYHLGRFDAEAKRQRHETVFPQDCQKAFDLGIRLARTAN
ncbi:MAG: flavodoxin family protein [Victivallales bacterium]|nr:flavodoxin family protein [Victivallales bacterium]